jgi:hypothetical protein
LIFVGRERETRLIADALRRGQNFIVFGRYGMGRTALVRHAAEVMGEDWHFAFADFERAPAEICEELLNELGGSASTKPHRRRGHTERPPGYLAKRAAVVRAAASGSRRPVIVLDNVCKVSAAKAGLIRSLADGSQFRFAAVVESFLPPADRVRLGVWLEPACRITLGCLERNACAEFFARFAAAHRTGWSAAEVDAFARATAGYPLEMQELAHRELARSRSGGLPDATRCQERSG